MRLPTRFDIEPKFYSSLSFQDSGKDCLLVKLDTISGKKDLLDDYCQKLKFPYFGNNLDALYDCLCDLSWIKEREIVIVHPFVSIADSSWFESYFRLLVDVVIDWETVDYDIKKCLSFCFSQKNKTEILKIVEFYLKNDFSEPFQKSKLMLFE